MKYLFINIEAFNKRIICKRRVFRLRSLYTSDYFLEQMIKKNPDWHIPNSCDISGNLGEATDLLVMIKRQKFFWFIFLTRHFKNSITFLKHFFLLLKYT